MKIQQVPLVSAILKHLGRQGVKGMVPRQMKAVIAAADGIVAAIAKEPVMATPGMGLDAWYASDDTGASSIYMAKRLSGRARLTDTAHHPLDPDDFGRCVRLLDAAPQLRAKLAILAGDSPTWGGYVAAWDELEALYREELPTGKATRLHQWMRQIQGEQP